MRVGRAPLYETVDYHINVWGIMEGRARGERDHTYFSYQWQPIVATPSSPLLATRLPAIHQGDMYKPIMTKYEIFQVTRAIWLSLCGALCVCVWI